MSNINIRLENDSSENEVIIKLIHTPVDQEYTMFRFSNSNKGIERNNLIITDENLNKIHPDGISFIIPKVNDTISTKISTDSPFEYRMVGKIIEEGLTIRVDFTSVEYIFERGKKYYLSINYNDTTSNALELQF